jgi:serine/threonine-protein kinase
MLPSMPKPSLKLELRPKDVIDGRYKVIKKLGEGGCGSVYRCHKLSDPEQLVAVKVLESVHDMPRFIRERKVLEGVEHQHVVGLESHGTHERYPFLALEYMAGGSLRDVLDARKTLSTAEAAWIGIMTVRGLRAAKTVHRDLKPENLLLTKDANGKVSLIPGKTKGASILKVADFGLAKSVDPKTIALTNTGHIMGTPLYMSPEQCRCTRDVQAQTDMYSLGIILFEMVTGHTPFDADSPYDLMAKHCNERPVFPRMDRQLQSVIERCLAKQAKDRYAKLKHLESDLCVIAGIAKPAEDEEASGTRPGTARVASWLLIGVGMLAFIALSYVLRDRLIDAAKGWMGDEPAKPVRPAANPALR